MSSNGDNEPPDKKPEPSEDVSLVPPGDAPPPPANVQYPGPSFNFAFVQNPSVLASLSPEAQRKVFEGLESDNQRSFDLSKLQLEMNERGRLASAKERLETRKQMLEERNHVRHLLLGAGGVLLAGIATVFVYLVIKGKQDDAIKFLAEVMKYVGGALAGSGATAAYKNSSSKRLP